jgi:hypothetical protein
MPWTEVERFLVPNFPVENKLECMSGEVVKAWSSEAGQRFPCHLLRPQDLGQA